MCRYHPMTNVAAQIPINVKIMINTNPIDIFPFSSVLVFGIFSSDPASTSNITTDVVV